MKKYIFTGVIFVLFISAAYSKRLDVGKDKVVKVNNHIITLKELEKKYNELLKLLPEGQKLTKKEVLQSMIEQELLLEEIRGAKSLVLNEEHFKQMLDQQKMLYSQLMAKKNPNFKFDEPKFKTYIEKELKITYEKYEQKIKEQVLARQYIEKKAQKKLQALRTKKYSSKSDFPVILPDMRGGINTYYSIKGYYDKNPAQFILPKNVELKHIFLVTLKPDGKGGFAQCTKDEKIIIKKKMEDIYKRLVKGESFDKLCELYTEDTDSRDAKNPQTGKLDRGYIGRVFISGQMGEMQKKQFGEKLFNAIFDLKKDKYSNVMEGVIGYHVFYVIDKKDIDVVKLEDVKEQIINLFKSAEYEKILTEEFSKTLKNLKAKASIVYYKNEYKTQ